MNTTPEQNLVNGYTSLPEEKKKINIAKPILGGVIILLLIGVSFGIYKQYSQLAQTDSSDASTPISYPITYPISYPPPSSSMPTTSPLSSPTASASSSPKPSPTASVSATVKPTSIPSPTLTPQPSPVAWQKTYQVESGSISGPFKKTTDNGRTVLYHEKSIFEPYTKNGLVKISINVPYKGVYFLQGNVRAPSNGKNSFLVNIDSNPSTSEQIWDIKPSRNYTTRTVTWRAKGKAETNYFTPQGFYMTEGNHIIYLKGREKETRIDTMTIKYVK